MALQQYTTRKIIKALYTGAFLSILKVKFCKPKTIFRPYCENRLAYFAKSDKFITNLENNLTKGKNPEFDDLMYYIENYYIFDSQINSCNNPCPNEYISIKFPERDGLPSGILFEYLQTKNYFSFQVENKTKTNIYLHQLICYLYNGGEFLFKQGFINTKDTNIEVDHIDQNTFNNNPENLQYLQGTVHDSLSRVYKKILEPAEINLDITRNNLLPDFGDFEISKINIFTQKGKLIKNNKAKKLAELIAHKTKMVLLHYEQTGMIVSRTKRQLDNLAKMTTYLKVVLKKATSKVLSFVVLNFIKSNKLAIKSKANVFSKSIKSLYKTIQDLTKNVKLNLRNIPMGFMPKILEQLQWFGYLTECPELATIVDSIMSMVQIKEVVYLHPEFDPDHPFWVKPDILFISKTHRTLLVKNIANFLTALELYIYKNVPLPLFTSVNNENHIVDNLRKIKKEFPKLTNILLV
jgi:hypothetical protein